MASRTEFPTAVKLEETGESFIAGGDAAGSWIGWIENHQGEVAGFVDPEGRIFRESYGDRPEVEACGPAGRRLAPDVLSAAIRCVPEQLAGR